MHHDLIVSIDMYVLLGVVLVAAGFAAWVLVRYTKAKRRDGEKDRHSHQ